MSRVLWHAKNVIRHTPGLYPLWKRINGNQASRVTTIPFGPMRGMKWFTAPGLPLWYRLGLYEPHVSRLIQTYLPRGGVFWDIGANAGYHSLLASRTADVVSVEANPVMYEMLEKQRALNGGSNWSLEPVAIGAEKGTASFAQSPNPLQSGFASIGAEGDTIEVSVETLDGLLNRHPVPSLVKIDIEGAESMALNGATDLLGSVRPVMLVSTHADQHSECLSLLRQARYSPRQEKGFEQMLVALPD